MQVKFRPTNTDEERLADVWFNSCPDPDSIPEVLQQLTKVELLELFNKDILTGSAYSHYWLVEVDCRAVGYLLVTSSNKPYGNCSGSAVIQEIYVLSAYRSQGIEKQALNIVEDFCDERRLHLSFLNKPEWKLFED